MKRALLPASLLIALSACRQPGPAVARPYAPAEEGLTLVYIDPSLPKDEQDAKRIQVRVDRVVERPDGATVVFKSFTVGINEPLTALFVLKDGGVGLLSPDGKSESPMLPAGFPEASSWTTAGVGCRVIGRGAWMRGAKVLPADRPSVGVWVETQPAKGLVTRTLYLPGLGEVERDERQADGRWATVNLLTQYGFTELREPQMAAGAPAPAQADTKPAPKRATKRKG